MNCADCLPLKVGDEAYILRRQIGGLCIRHGIVSEINITHQHRPMFTVHYVGRGYYGDTVFKTLEEAAARLEELRRKGATQDADTKKIKIGGKVYEVEITDKLWLGAANVSAEIDYTDLVIRVSPAARGKMEADFIHEVCHGIADAMGYKDHNEREIDALAQMLYQVIQDNPEMFQPDRPETEEVPNCSDR